MANCVTCGSELHPERAEKYNYCTDRKCQERNAKGLTILALAVNKAADQYQVLDGRTSERVASGRYVEEMATGTWDHRRAWPDPEPGREPDPEPGREPDPEPGREPDPEPQPGQRERGRHQRARRPARTAPPARRAAAPQAPRRPWSKSQQELAVIYNARGMRPDEVARKLNLSTPTVIEMLLAARRPPR